MTLDTKVHIKETVFLQEVDGETILLDTESEEYFSLNEVGSIFYHILKEEDDLRVIVDELSTHFDLSKEKLQRDLFAFIETLSEKKLVTID